MPEPTRRPPAATLRSAALRAAGFAALWWVLTEGWGGGWALAALFVGAATAASVTLHPGGPRGASAVGAASFVLLFVSQAVLGGIDVARRALHPRLPIRPGLSEHRLRIRGETARLLLLSTFSLLPGTLSARLRGDRLLVHSLDASDATGARLAEIERRLARALGAALDD